MDSSCSYTRLSVVTPLTYRLTQNRDFLGILGCTSVRVSLARRYKSIFRAERPLNAHILAVDISVGELDAFATFE